MQVELPAANMIFSNHEYIGMLFVTMHLKRQDTRHHVESGKAIESNIATKPGKHFEKSWLATVSPLVSYLPCELIVKTGWVTSIHSCCQEILLY